MNGVLVVEDSKAEQQRMLVMLERFGHQVLTADDGEEALEILRNEPISLVLTD